MVAITATRQTSTVVRESVDCEARRLLARAQQLFHALSEGQDEKMIAELAARLEGAKALLKNSQFVYVKSALQPVFSTLKGWDDGRIEMVEAREIAESLI